jgi:AcrR family transcriptional regulator
VSGRSTKATKPPPLKTRLREAASEAILDAVEDILLERGIDGAAIASIAERAGVAVGTLYNYFPDRDAMISALFRARRAEILPRIVAAAAHTDALAFEPRLREYVRQVFAVFDEHRPFVRIAISLDQQGRRLPAPEPNLMTLFHQHLEAILRIGPSPARVAEHTSMFAGALKGYNHWAIEHDQTADVDLLVDTFLRGVAP